MLTFGWLASEVTRRQQKKSPRGRNINVAEVSDALQDTHDILASIPWGIVAGYYTGTPGLARNLAREVCRLESKRKGAKRAYELSIAQMAQVLKVERGVMAERSLGEIAGYFARRKRRRC